MDEFELTTEEKHDKIPFWFRFALFAKRVEAILKREGAAELVATRLAQENARLRQHILADARERGLPLKVGPWDPVSGQSDLSVAARPRDG